MTVMSEKNKRGGARPGSGRPPKKHPAQRITLRVPYHEYKLLLMYSEFYGCTHTDIILEALNDYLTRQCLTVNPRGTSREG